MSTIKRALISVSDKRGVVEFARALARLGVELVSTGGTARLLADSGVKAIDIGAYTGFPEMLDGRVKTLHPRVHAGILARRDVDAHMRTLRERDIPPIDLVAVNLYPFQQTIAQPNVDLASAIEQIDIGGPTLLRAAAKNFAGVTVVVDPDDYSVVLDAMRREPDGVDPALRLKLATKAFEHTARYDGAIAGYLGGIAPDGAPLDFPQTFNLQLRHLMSLRYGENPHQRAAFYVDPDAPRACIATARQVQGKELSFNNIADADAALECVKSFEPPACVIVKHANPCGVAIADDILEAYRRAYATDPISAFGGIIAFNRALDAESARAILERQFVEVIVAPAIEPDARAVLAGKPGVRVLETGEWQRTVPAGFDFKRVVGGVLIQDRDNAGIDVAELKTVTRRAPSERELQDLLFAWTIVKFVKSNAVVYCKDGRTLGVGAGQTSRVHSARIGTMKALEAGLEVRGSVMASDAFFPFRDGLDQAAAAGVAAVIQPGGSLRDREVIDAADEHGIAMVFTGKRHFRH